MYSRPRHSAVNQADVKCVIFFLQTSKSNTQAKRTSVFRQTQVRTEIEEYVRKIYICITCTRMQVRRHITKSKLKQHHYTNKKPALVWFFSVRILPKGNLCTRE